MKRTKQTGMGDDLWVYLAEDDEGETGVLIMETAGSARVPLIAETRAKADTLRPIAARLATMTGHTVTLAHFGSRDDIEVIEP